MFSSGLFTETFMVHAWMGGTMVAVLCALVGFFVVMRDSAFVAHTVPQAGFAGGAGAVFLNVNPLYGLSVFAVGGALLIGYLGTRERNDVATALILVAALGTGALFLGLTNKYATGAYALLFGQLVGVSSEQIVTTAILSLICLLALAFLYRPLLLASVSKEIAQSRGIPVRWVEMCFMVIVGLTAAITVPVVGALLCFSLLIGPTAVSILLTSSSEKVMALSLLFSVLTVWLSLILGYYSGWPIGFFVSIIGAILYLAARSIKLFRYKTRALFPHHAR
ncbi:ABC transporter, TroCD-like [Acididesulfobacillus acetoxydans]|uniref:ABC transporter, TroCD-like n=1 Tax=Acididesulfobacillus acetoxydans TaxID=1561005 RepID=A0A8S0XXY0_9FIRM|nr:metal ABC transporter permease [Acididesulfobacillus acetoxydans]CAA7601977.1 ABC transporter, TroCD-like [Acididesulfobacillus acetoxydans]CEJ08179.1 ABC-type transporter, integral membrane subunit [Acididesulfobacillus acetoxydans]